MNAFLASLDLGDDDLGHDLVPHHDLLIERRGSVVQLGVKAATAPLTLQIIYAIMLCVDQSAVRRDAKLIWSFSSVAIEVAELGALIERWDETGEPPLLSIIALVLGKDRHVTRGMTVFVGYELAAQVADPAQSRNAASNLARLARHAIINGGLAVDTLYDAVDGDPLRLDWGEAATSPAMVTILL
jgi:hypothetical protein